MIGLWVKSSLTDDFYFIMKDKITDPVEYMKRPDGIPGHFSSHIFAGDSEADPKTLFEEQLFDDNGVAISALNMDQLTYMLSVPNCSAEWEGAPYPVERIKLEVCREIAKRNTANQQTCTRERGLQFN